MYQAIIVEDQPQALQLLLSDLNAYFPDIEVVGSSGSVVGAAKLLKSAKVDLLFLDITLSDGTAFDLLEIVNSPQLNIIFITASEEHALKAFRFSAIDYLLKPIDKDLLIAAVEKAKRMAAISASRLEILKNTIERPNELPKKVSLHTQEKIIVINIIDIIRCESDGNNTWFYLSNGDKVFVTKTLKHYDELFEGHNFVRVHQSHLINFQHVAEFSKKDGGFLKMKNGHEVPVSVRKKSELMDMFDFD